MEEPAFRDGGTVIKSGGLKLTGAYGDLICTADKAGDAKFDKVVR